VEVGSRQTGKLLRNQINRNLWWININSEGEGSFKNNTYFSYLGN
jgi:hypothetical protein